MHVFVCGYTLANRLVLRLPANLAQRNVDHACRWTNNNNNKNWIRFTIFCEGGRGGDAGG